MVQWNDDADTPKVDGQGADERFTLTTLLWYVLLFAMLLVLVLKGG